MKNFETIIKKVKSEVNENTIVVYYNADLINVSPFMCSPFMEEWIYSSNINEIIDYLFEIVISNYIINELLLTTNFNSENLDEIDFIQAIDIYKKNKSINEIEENTLKELLYLYKNTKRKLTYLEFVKVLVQLENSCEKIGISLYFESYSNPLDARHSKNLSTEKFNYIVLKENF